MEAIGQLAGGIAHDFNNLLTVIIGNASFALMCVPPTDPVHEDLTEVNQAAMRAADLTKQLLAYSRKQVLALRQVDVDELVGRVRDSGDGMSRDVLARAYEPFSTTKEVGKGTGLDLSSVYGTVKQCGGHVTAESEEGRGTTITVYLPRCLEAVQATSDAPSA